MKEVSDILNGKISKWNQLAGNDTTAIKIVFDNAESSTVSYLRDKFLPKGKKLSETCNSFAQENNAQVFDIVKTDPNALGVISVSWLGEDLSVAKKVPMDQRMEDYSNQNDTIASKLTSEVNILKISNPNEDNDFQSGRFQALSGLYLLRRIPLGQKGLYGVNRIQFHGSPQLLRIHDGIRRTENHFQDRNPPYHMNPRVVELK